MSLQNTVDAVSAALPSGKQDPSQLSSEIRSMQTDLQLICDVLGGLGVVQKKQEYLPKFEGEDQVDYDRRRLSAPWRPEFIDCIKGLTSKPFTKEIVLKAGASEALMLLGEDIDGRGNNLTSFCRETFFKGIAKGVQGIMVDYPNMHKDDSAPRTIAEEKASGARPYWLHVEAENFIALYTEWVQGKEIVEHVRIKENFVIRDGFTEILGVRIRVYEPGKWEVWEKKGSSLAYERVSQGVISRPGGKTSVPLALFFTGERLGDIRTRPPMIDLAHMQIELYRGLSRQEEILTFAASPMLTANGMKKPEDGSPVKTGPKTVLYAPPGVNGGGNTSWAYISPDSATIKEIREQVEGVIDDMRRLGLQPLVARTGRPTATGDSIEAARAHSQVQAWAMDFKDVLEQAFVYTAEWIGETNHPEVVVYTDFSPIPASQAPLASLATARATRDISRETLWEGMQRFDVLPPDFDAVKEMERLTAEAKAPQIPIPPVPKRDPATGFVVPPVPAGSD